MRKLLVVQNAATKNERAPLPPGTDDVAWDALNWLMSEVDEEVRLEVFERFPEPSREALMDKVLSLWSELADRGAFRDAVEVVFLRAQDSDRGKALPRIQHVLVSKEHSIGARAFALGMLQRWWTKVAIPELPPEELGVIEVDFLGDCGFSGRGSVQNTSEYLASLMWDDREGETPYLFVERIRQRVGMPYAFAHYFASMDSAPWQEEILIRLSSTGCLTTKYLLRLAHLDAMARTRSPEYMVAAHTPELIEHAIRASSVGPSPVTLRDEWFRSAKFWFSPCDTHGNYFLTSWVPTPRPGGNFALAVLGPTGVLDGRCERSVPEAVVPSQIMRRPLSPIDARLALSLVRRAFELWSGEKPPESLDLELGPGAEFDAVLHIEHAAVQSLCAQAPRSVEGDVEALNAKLAASPARLAALLASDAYAAWGRPSGIVDMIELALGAMDWRTDLQKRMLADIGRVRLGAACRHMALWHRSRSEHAEAAMINAAARDLEPPGTGTIILEALTDLWVNIVTPSADHPLSRTTSESIRTLVELKTHSAVGEAEHPSSAARGRDFQAVCSLALAMLETTLKNYSQVGPGAELGEVAALVAEGMRSSVELERLRVIQSRCATILGAQGLGRAQADRVLRDVRLALLNRGIRLPRQSSE